MFESPWVRWLYKESPFSYDIVKVFLGVFLFSNIFSQNGLGHVFCIIGLAHVERNDLETFLSCNIGTIPLGGCKRPIAIIVVLIRAYSLH